MPKISPISISGYDVKLYNPDTGREVIRRTKGYEPFYILMDEDECFRQEMTMVEVSLIESIAGCDDQGEWMGWLATPHFICLPGYYGE